MCLRGHSQVTYSCINRTQDTQLHQPQAWSPRPRIPPQWQNLQELEGTPLSRRVTKQHVGLFGGETRRIEAAKRFYEQRSPCLFDKGPLRRYPVRGWHSPRPLRGTGRQGEGGQRLRDACHLHRGGHQTRTRARVGLQGGKATKQAGEVTAGPEPRSAASRVPPLLGPLPPRAEAAG